MEGDREKNGEDMEMQNGRGQVAYTCILMYMYM